MEVAPGFFLIKTHLSERDEERWRICLFDSFVGFPHGP